MVTSVSAAAAIIDRGQTLHIQAVGWRAVVINFDESPLAAFLHFSWSCRHFCGLDQQKLNSLDIVHCAKWLWFGMIMDVRQNLVYLVEKVIGFSENDST